MNKNNKDLYTIIFISLTSIFLGNYLSATPIILLGVGVASIGMIFLSDFKKTALIFALLPWLEVMKISPDTPTLFHILYIIFIIKGLFSSKKIDYTSTLLMILLFCHVMFVRLLFNYSNSFDIGFFAYFISLIFITIFSTNLKKYFDPIICSKVLAFSVILAYTAEIVYRFNGLMKEYLSFVTYAPIETAIRSGGLLYDANFMATLTLLTIVFYIYMLFYTKNKGNKVIHISILSILIIFGTTTVSKMYFISLAIIFIFSSIHILKKPKISYYVLFLVSIFVVQYILVETTLFTNIFERFTSGDLTTGRFDLVIKYIEFFSENINTFFFGIGMYDSVYMVGKSTHNTFITLIYQLGVIGTLIYTLFILSVIKKFKINKAKKTKFSFLLIFIILGISLFSLDLLMYEMLPIFIIITLGCSYGSCFGEENLHE